MVFTQNEKKSTGDKEKSSIACYRASIVVIFSHFKKTRWMVYFLSISKNSFGIMILSMIFLLRMKTNYFSNYSDDNEKQYIVFKI